MKENGFSRKAMKAEVAAGNLNIEQESSRQIDDSTLRSIIDYQFKTNLIQCISAGLMMILGIVLSFVNENGIGVTIGSLVQGDTTVSNITVNLGALLIFGGLYVFLNVIKNSNTNYKVK